MKKLENLQKSSAFLTSSWLQPDELRILKDAITSDPIKNVERQAMLIKAPYLNTEDIQSILIHYDKKDIYNCDETALFWLMEPNRTLSHGPVQGAMDAKTFDLFRVLLVSIFGIIMTIQFWAYIY